MIDSLAGALADGSQHVLPKMASRTKEVKWYLLTDADMSMHPGLDSLVGALADGSQHILPHMASENRGRAPLVRQLPVTRSDQQRVQQAHKGQRLRVILSARLHENGIPLSY